MQSQWPHNSQRFVTAHQVAAFLGYKDLRAFHRDKPWRDAQGFPPQPLKRRWRASQIEAWLAARERGQCQRLPNPANEDTPPEAGTARAKLDALRAALAGKEARNG